MDGESIELLLDTGATSKPAPASVDIQHAETTNGIGVTSYITSDVLDRWHSRHPEWRVIENGDDLFAPRFIARMIEVPQITVADWQVGPVWFTERPGEGFHRTMDSLMDQPVSGALGGNVLQPFTVTIDYPHDRAWLTCLDHCK